MKLSSVLAKRTLDQLEEQTTFHDTQVIPDNNPAVPQLNQIFGDHTFFLDEGGLHIVEPVEPPERAAPEVRVGKLVKLASWRDAGQTSLAPHKPQPTDVVVVLGTEDELAADDEAEGKPDGAA